MSNRPLRSANASPLSQDWVAAAERARAALEAAPTGRKVPALEEVAERYGIGRDLLRRAVTALRLIETLAKRGVAVPDELHQVPIGVVDIITRWASYDRETAFDAVRRYHRGDIQFRELMRAEAAARPVDRAKRTPRRNDVVRAFKEACLGKLAIHLKKAGLVPADDVDSDLLVDGFARSHASRAVTAIMIAGPFEDEAHYRATMIRYLTEVIGLTRLGHPVWVVVPKLTIARSYKAWLETKGISATTVRVVELRGAPALSEFS